MMLMNRHHRALLIRMQVGGCTCMTKTNVIQYHATDCQYRLAGEIEEVLTFEDDTAPQSSQPVDAGEAWVDPLSEEGQRQLYDRSPVESAVVLGDERAAEIATVKTDGATGSTTKPWTRLFVMDIEIDRASDAASMIERAEQINRRYAQARAASPQAKGRSMKEIVISEGNVVLVDDEDYEKALKVQWYICLGYARGYARQSLGMPVSTLLLHRYILGLAHGDKRVVDHANGNKLDNRKANLRICTQVENQRNKPVTKHNRSGLKGVGRHKGRWRARIRADGREIHIGYFDTVEEAHTAWRSYAEKLHGEFANFGDSHV
jgi:hypothetical protein